MEIYKNLNNTNEDPPGKKHRQAYRERESSPDGSAAGVRGHIC